MKVAGCVLFVLIFHVVSNHRCEASVGDGIAVIQLGMDIAGGIRELLKNAILAGESETMKRISTLYTRIDSVEENLKTHNIAVTFQNSLKHFPHYLQLNYYFDKLNEQIDSIAGAYSDFKVYANLEKYNRSILKKIAAWCTSPDGLSGYLQKLHALIIPAEESAAKPRLLNLLAENLKVSWALRGRFEVGRLPEVLCQMVKMTPTINWSNLIADKFTEETDLAKTTWEGRMNETFEAFKTAIAPASPYLWKGDPPYPIGEDAYTELTWFLQAYVVNEADVSSANTCDGKCGDYKFVNHHTCLNGSTRYCSAPKCEGQMYDCQHIGSKLQICPANRDTNRRYNNIRYGNGVKDIYGPNETCTRTDIAESWKKGSVDCDFCLCYCDGEICESDRYFNMREAVADIQSNKVITGIKFVKVHQVIHLQIEQGELLGSGEIANTTEWKSVQDYSIHDKGVKNGVDYKTLSWDHRDVDLDDLTAEPGYCLTGVRFRMLGSHLNLQIRTTPFNFTSGVLEKSLEKSVWHGNDNTDASEKNPRTRVQLTEPDRSTLSEDKSIPDSKTNQYIQFQPTDLKKDVAQSAVPFIDTQPVVPHPRILLAGAGIYHKGIKGYGGFIAPKVMTYNFMPHLHIDESIPNPGVEVAENMRNGLMAN